MKSIARIVCGFVALFVAAPAFAGSSQGWMYWAERDTDLIHRTHLDGTGDEILFSSLDGVLDPEGIALDVANNWVYWTMGETSHKVQRGRLDGTGPVETLITMPNPGDELTHIVLDLTGGKMYFARTTTSDGTIFVANLDGSNMQEFFVAETPSALAIDPVAGKLYWGLSPGLGCSGQAKIQRSNLDGTEVEDVPNFANLGVVRAIAVDSKLDWIYWGESCGAGVRRAHFDGSGMESMMPDSSRGIALDAESLNIYWTRVSPDPDKIRRANLDFEDVDDLVPLAQFPFGIAILLDTPTDPADLNGNGIVNGIDLAILLGAWGACPPRGGCDADLAPPGGGDGIVNGFDLALLLGAWTS